jgi:hypothetical protein
MEYIRSFYGVNAKIGGKILYKYKHGTIVGTKGPYLRIRLDGEKQIENYHPTYEITYL